MQQGISPCGQFVQEGFMSWASWVLSSISCPLPTGRHPSTNAPHIPPCTMEAQVQAGRGQLSLSSGAAASKELYFDSRIFPISPSFILNTRDAWGQTLE